MSQIELTTENQPMAGPQLTRIQIVGVVMAIVGGAATFFSVESTQQFFHSYLMAYFFWFGLGLGSLAWLMIHHLAGARWGFILRRMLEAGAMMLPVLLILFVPILAGMGDIYSWTDPAYVASDPILEHKAPYLNVGGFITRAVLFFIIWCGLAFLFFKWSSDQDRAPEGDFSDALRMRYLSGAGIVLYVVTMTFAMVDWAMSIEPHWFSAMYPVIYMVGQGLSTLVFLVLIIALVGHTRPYSEVLSPFLIDNMGKLIFGFVIVWTYVSFGQFVIIWSGNIPEFTPWYVHRSGEGWQALSVGLVICHFGVPFFVLLFNKVKSTLPLLWMIAAWMVVLRMAEIFWLIAPDLYTDGLGTAPVLSYAAMQVALGGIWLTGFIWILKQRPLLPQNELRKDPRLQKGHTVL